MPDSNFIATLSIINKELSQPTFILLQRNNLPIDIRTQSPISDSDEATIQLMAITNLVPFTSIVLTVL